MRPLISADIERRRAERKARKDHRVRNRAKKGPRVERNMRFERRRTSKLTRTVRYGVVAVVALWSLLATLALAVLNGLGHETAKITLLDGWLTVSTPQP